MKPVTTLCRRLLPALETYLDGELGPSQVVEVEGHLTECPHCREFLTFDRATRASLQNEVRRPAPDHLREKLRVALLQSAETAVDARLMSTANERLLPVGRVSPRYAFPLVATAACALFFSLQNRLPASAERAAGGVAGGVTNQASMVTGFDSLLEELVGYHAQPLPPEVTRTDEVRNFDPFVGVPVEPPRLQNYGATWLGGRMLPLREHRAAMLQYSLAGGHRVTVYVYDPKRVRNESKTLHARHLRSDVPIYVGSVRGYNVAATERRGVGYALATDLDEPESLELVAGGVP